LASSYFQAAICSGSLIGGGIGWNGRALSIPLVGPVPVVEALELAQSVEQVVLVPDQGLVEQLATAGLHPPFR
jgi:hypothetical protein